MWPYACRVFFCVFQRQNACSSKESSKPVVQSISKHSMESFPVPYISLRRTAHTHNPFALILHDSASTLPLPCLTFEGCFPQNHFHLFTFLPFRFAVVVVPLPLSMRVVLFRWRHASLPSLFASFPSFTPSSSSPYILHTQPRTRALSQAAHSPALCCHCCHHCLHHSGCSRGRAGARPLSHRTGCCAAGSSFRRRRMSCR